MAISVGSVEVDVVPNTRGIYAQLRSQLEPAATRAGRDAGNAAGRAFGPAMRSEVGAIGLSIGQQIGSQIAARITAEIRGALRDGITQGGRTATPAATRQGQQAGGAFSRAARVRIEAAFRSLPDVTIGADTSEADADIQALRVRLETLSRQRIGIDIDTATARAEIQRVENELRELGRRHPNPQVRADTASARAELAALRAQIDGVDGRRINITTEVSTRQAVRALLQLSIAVAGLAAIPAVPVLAAGIGSIAAAATAAGAGIGALGAVAAPAIKDIAGALTAQKAAQEAATTATGQGGQAAAAAARQALQQSGAQQALAAAHRNAARQISQAQQGVQDAVRSAAQANTAAAQQVRSARQQLAGAYEQAADRMRQANERVRSAEQSLADAQRTARQAQQDLTQARRDAKAELVDLSNRLASAQLSERDATLSVQEAQARLRATQAAGSTATELEQQRAQLAYEQAVQRLREQRLDTKRLAADKATANRTGVAGTETVRTAEERLASARRGVATQEAALSTARQEMARQQIDNSRDIAAAQDRVAQAQRNVASVQEQGARSVARAQQQLAAARQTAADSIASAERQVASAQIQSAGGADAAATAQAKYQAALAKLTPSARGTFDAFVSLRTAFTAWSRSLQPAVMPIFTRALNGLKNSLPGLTPFVLAAARGITTLQDRVSRGFKSPWWKGFKKDLAGSVESAIVGLGVSFARIFKGMAGVIQAFLPHMDDISRKMQDVTGGFADWGTGLKGSPQFEGFLAYSSRMGPQLAEALREIGRAFWQIGLTLEPLSGPLLRVLAIMADGIADLAEHAPWLIQLIYLAVIATKLWTLAIFALNFVMRQNPIVRIAILIGILIAAVVYAWHNFGWFRTAVRAAWSGIQAAALWAWNSVLKPVFAAIWAAVRAVGRVAMWLWKNAIAPAFRGIATVAKWLVIILAVLVVGPIVLAFRLLAWVGKWLWRNALAPAFRGIAAGARWLWNNVLRPVVNAIVAIFRFLGRVAAWLWRNALAPAFRGIGAVAKWLWDKIIRPVFNWIADKTKWLYRNGVKPSFDAIKKAVGLVATAFSKAKDGIGKAWDKLKSLTKKPIAWVIDWVYNKGVVGLWNAAASVLPIKKLKKFNVKGWATGGPVYGPGTETSDSIPAVLSRNEHVWTAREVKGVGGHAAMESMRAAARRSGTAYAKGGAVAPTGAHGGIIDWVGDKVKDVGKKIKGWALGGVHAAAKLAAKPIRALIDKIPGGGSGFGSLAKAVPKGMLEAALNAIKGSEDSQMGSGQWIKPVNAKYGTRFGVKGGMWSSGRHTGLDFPAPTGKKVVAVDNGSITSARSGGPYGNHIQVSHGGGLSSLYAHLSRIVERAGAVKRGQQIGKVGSTGNSSGPHLHLEARKSGKPVDPMPYLTGGGGAGGKGAARWRGVASAVLRELGVYSKYNLNAILRTITKESGGNPRAINLWDSNAKRGTPSKGLIQTIDPTFRAYAGKYRSRGPYDPYANIYAGVRYARSRYGSGWAARMSRPGGYDSGGYLQPGLNLAYNGTGRPEPVFTSAQANALMKLSAVGGTATAGDMEVHVYVGDREITDIVRTEVHSSQRQLTTALRAGRG